VYRHSLGNSSPRRASWRLAALEADHDNRRAVPGQPRERGAAVGASVETPFSNLLIEFSKFST